VFEKAKREVVLAPQPTQEFVHLLGKMETSIDRRSSWAIDRFVPSLFTILSLISARVYWSAGSFTPVVKR